MPKLRLPVVGDFVYRAYLPQKPGKVIEVLPRERGDFMSRSDG